MGLKDMSQPNTSPPKAILFDWDNTLVESLNTSLEALNATLEHFNLPLFTLEQLRLKPHVSAKDGFPKIFGDEWQQAIQVYCKKYEDIHLDSITAFDGADELLKNIHDQNIALAIVSNKNQHILEKEVQHMNWQGYFPVIVGSGTAKFDKPHASHANKALNLLNLSSSTDIWLAGDSPIDIECAINAGCLPVSLRPSHTSEIQDNPPEDVLHFSCLKQFNTYLLGK